MSEGDSTRMEHRAGVNFRTGQESFAPLDAIISWVIPEAPFIIDMAQQQSRINSTSVDFLSGVSKVSSRKLNGS